ncbi:protein disulfide isomerase [Chloropicon primus]|uniref:Protein disulfide isomerase n=1 Tax=Chloropicon primus TaxID=1764295 RepID=A0A5B8MJF3_9CHLO|nr:protein disulfide isomerase [Chloropicon primus]UPQ99827.1 protein disulfide isomerase [Chloropicon primus]|eukprot:QDZ20616.1 protein disulfide isomerase [Chloropicon primus]
MATGKMKGLSLRNLVIGLVIQGIILASLAAAAKGDAPKGRAKVVTLRPRKFFDTFEEIRNSKRKEVSVVMVYIPSKVDQWDEEYASLASRMKDEDGVQFYKIDKVHGGKDFSELDEAFGPGVAFSTMTEKKPWRVYMVENGVLATVRELYMGRDLGEPLDGVMLMEEIKLRLKGTVYEVQKGEKYDDVRTNYEYSYAVIGYFPSKLSLSRVGFHGYVKMAQKTNPFAFFYETKSPDFVKSALGDDFEQQPDTVVIIRNFDGLHEVIPGQKNPVNYHARISEKAMAEIIDQELMETYTNYAKAYDELAEMYFTPWYERNVYRLEVVFPRERYGELARIVRDANAAAVEKKYTSRVIHYHPLTEKRNTRCEVLFEFKNDTSDIMIGAVHQKKMGYRDNELYWKLDLEGGKELTVEYMSKWLTQLGNNELSPFNEPDYGVKSERRPKFNTGLVKKVVGFTFDEFVNSGKNVFLYIYANSNQNSKDFVANELKDLAKKYEGDEDLAFAKVNGPKNKINDDRFQLDSYPQIFLVNANMEVIKYEGLHLRDELVEFIDSKRSKIFSREDVLEESKKEL